jgi:NADH-quinone oxidoreductase subunit J
VPEGLARPESPHGPRLAGAALAVVLAAELVVALWLVARSSGLQPFGDPASVATSVGSIRAIGRSLFTDHTFAFEATSVLVLVAMLGAVVLAKRKVE